MPVKCLRKQKGYNSNIKLVNLIYTIYVYNIVYRYVDTLEKESNQHFRENNKPNQFTGEEKNPETSQHFSLTKWRRWRRQQQHP